MTHNVTSVMRVITVMAIAVLATSISIHAQTSISGFLNTASAVRSIRTEGCASFLRVEDTTGFASGDEVLVIQSMGCTDTAGYDVSDVGRFERATIHALDASGVVELERPLLHRYRECGRIQIVRIAMHTGTVIVQDTLRVRAWNGRSGGVLCMDVRGSLVLNAPINVSGAGYAGGTVWNGSGQCSTTVADAITNHPDAAMKGGTCVVPQSTQVAGGAALFSGGGGGLGHNSGGGGGAGSGHGGRGGAQWQGCGARFDNGGRGGTSDTAVVNDIGRLRFGGGGGAGQMNNGRGTNGGAGGGIVILWADTIVGNGYSIEARGLSAQMAGNDGAGGGGGGGCILVACSAIRGTVTCSVIGGTGGDVSVGDLHGPGGGGGGGAVLFSDTLTPAGMICRTGGGAMGRCTTIGDTMTSRHLAEAGTDGRILLGAVVPRNTTSTRASRVTILRDTSLCAGQSCMLSLRVIRDNDTLTTAPEVEWREQGGAVVGTGPTLMLTPRRSSRHVVTIRDSAGCTARDTASVGIMTTSDVSVQSADVGTAFCERFIDTSIVVTNTGSARITVADLRLDRPGCSVIDTLPVTIAAGDSLRVRVRVKTGSVRGSDSVTALARVLPCDTVYACMLRWIRDTRPGAVSPRAVRMQETFSCSAISIDTTVSCLIGRDEGTVHTVLCEGSVSYTGTLPLLITRSTAVPLAVRWTPMPMATRGRAGLVVRSDGCDDTLWIEVDGMARMPRITAPDSVETGPILVCADSAVVVDFALRSADSTLWRITAVSAPPEVTLDRTIGDSAMGDFSIRARVTPQRVGAFAYPVDITVRPCDTTVRIWVKGTGITAILSHTDTLTITEPMVGRSTITSVALHNTGTEPVTISGIDHAPRDPFATVAFVPDLPCTIASGDSLRCFIRLLQECGDHVDSLVFLTTNPCAPREKLVLNSQARAVTRVRIPDVEMRVGDTGVVPVLMDGRPSIETSMLDSFTVEIAVRPADLWVTDGADDRCSWMCTSGDSLTRIRINGRWRNDDTLAVIPVRTLLSTAVSTPVTFNRNSGFGWTAHPCDVAYTDGSVIFGDVCGSRRLRSVSWSPTPTYVVAPNPTSGELSIIPTGTHPSPYLLTIVDALGMVRETVACTGMQVIDLRHLPDGMYGLRLVSGADLQTRCVIKR